MAGFTFDSKHCYTYFMRTVPNIKNNLMPPEKSISELFIKSFFNGYECRDMHRTISITR